VAFEYGADGVYVINHLNFNKQETLDVLDAIKDSNTENFVGVNFLTLGVDGVFRYLYESHKNGNLKNLPDAIWSDNANSNHSGLSLEQLKKRYDGLRHIKLLGGIAFKYSAEYTDSPVQAQIEVKNNQDKVDIITTSGPGTGQPPSFEKIAAMKEIAAKPIALASGIDASNIDQFRGIVDEILAASSVETQSYSGIFDKAKLKELIDLAHKE